MHFGAVIGHGNISVEFFSLCYQTNSINHNGSMPTYGFGNFCASKMLQCCAVCQVLHFPLILCCAACTRFRVPSKCRSLCDRSRMIWVRCQWAYLSLKKMKKTTLQGLNTQNVKHQQRLLSVLTSRVTSKICFGVKKTQVLKHSTSIGLLLLLFRAIQGNWETEQSVSSARKLKV